MGKSLLIKGADFSVNGMKVNNVVNVELATGGTNPYVFFFLPTPFTYIENVNTDPTLPGDAVTKSVNQDSAVDIEGNFNAFGFGRVSGDSTYKTIKKISAAYSSQLSDAYACCRGLFADEIDLRGLSFSPGIVSSGMFALASVSTLKMPDMEVASARNMFYNFCHSHRDADIDFSFLKKVTSDLTSMFSYLKCRTAIFKNMDTSSATVFNSAFIYCQMEEVDLSTWTFAAATHVISMFSTCPNLKTIHLDSLSKTISYYTNMFASCPALTTVYVTNCSSAVKTWLIARLNEASAGGSSNWTESTIGGKAALIKGA